MTSDRLAVLAVEDEAVIALELENMLEDMGYDVIGPAANVEAALALLRSASPDAAVVDANLAGKSARPILEALQKDGIPLVLASGYEELELRNLGLEAPLVRKPYSAKDLSTALQAACGTQPRNASR